MSLGPTGTSSCIQTGIDTMRIVARVAARLDDRDELRGHDLGTDRARWAPRRSGQLPSGAWFTLRDGRVWIGASLPMMMFGSNFPPLPVPMLREALTRLLGEASHIVGFEALDSIGEMGVRRLDAAHDFATTGNLSLLLDGLVGGGQQASASIGRWADSTGLSRTLTVTTRTSWECSLYDKHGQTLGSAPEGLLRFEARLLPPRLTSKWATSHGGRINVVDDITETKVEAMAKGMFDHVGFNRAVMSEEAMAVRVMADTKLSDHDKLVLIGLLTAQAAGVPGRPSAATAKKYRDEARRLGLAVQPRAGVRARTLAALEDPTPGHDAGRRLDWVSSREMVA